MGANELSSLLWRERELLELLIFKLEEEQLLLMSGKTRWLQHATQEVEQVMVRLREAGLARSVEVAGLAREWNTAEDSTLRDVVAGAPRGPWADIFTAHLTAMSALTSQIKSLRDINEQFLRAASRSTQETLAGVGADAHTYGARGTSDSGTHDARLFDQSL